MSVHKPSTYHGVARRQPAKRLKYPASLYAKVRGARVRMLTQRELEQVQERIRKLRDGEHTEHGKRIALEGK